MAMDQQQAGKKQATNSPEMALASEVFDQFCNASTLKSILGYYRQLCELLKIRPNVINQFYPKLKTKLRSWKAQALWKKFDQRANHKCYNRGKACPNTRILIIGGGPCGLRSAIEAQLLGAKVVVVEKRDRMSRNNVLHLWPFVIQDLRGLGAKKFFGKFCAGSIDHISIRQLQCILLKVALILGVEFHESVSFDSLVQPPDNQEDGKIGWRAKTSPADHPVSQYEFDVLIGADGKRNTLEGFKRKEFRGKLAIAITANFINKRTEAEARVEEISGVAFIFNQKFFKELYKETGIDLENIVYYKDDTHYFVMTAKKHSLIDKGVILQDHADTAKLLAKENVDREALMLYAREAAEFSTEYQMMDMEFAVNHYGQPDVAMFDFTSMYAAENASRVLERHSHRLLMILVGDSLLEPFWPTGSGCARGFLSSLDAGWAIKGWGASLSPLEVIAERESIYRLLGQTTPENLNRDYAAYTLDPHTRYPNLNVRSVTPIQVRSLLDTDDPESIQQPAIQSEIDIPKKRRRRDLRADAQVHPDTLLRWLQKQVALYDKIHIEDMGASFKDGLAICAIIHRYRPDLIDFYGLNAEDIAKNNQLAFDTLEKELSISPIMTGEEMVQCDVPDKLAMFSYLTQIYEAFRGEIPYVKHPKLEPDVDDRAIHPKQLNQLTSEQRATKGRHSRSSRHANENVQLYTDKKGDTTSRRSRKRRSTEKMGATMDERQKRLDEIEKHRNERMKKRQYLRKMATQQFYKSMQMLQANAKREKDEPFEDYSIFLYRQTAPDFKDRVKDLEQKILYPDRESKVLVGYRRGSMDEEFSGRIKDFEDKLKGTASSEKKPKDLLRAIGKIEKTDWNVKEIEKKIEENKMGRGVRHDRVERVPKWSREQFLARQIKMEKRGNDQRDTYSKYADIDSTLQSIGKKIREGNALGYNKVSAMAEQFSNKNQDAEPKLQKSNTKPMIVLPAQGGSEMCHFCNKRVYLMERLSAEGKFFHRGCFRCEYCSISLRIGNHTFDREKNGGHFYCTQHFGLSGTTKARGEKKKMNLNKENLSNVSVTPKIPEKAKIPIKGFDLLDRGQTPERIEFENLAGISDPEEAHSQMDEDEWTDRNFGASTAEVGSSDDISDMSDSDEDNEVFEEAIDQPLTTEGTLELAKNWTLRYSHPHATIGQSDTGSNEYEDSSDEYTSEDDESGTATEDEEDVRARELRKQEVWLKMPPRNSDTDTGSETEVKHSQDSIDLVIAQESLIFPDSKIKSKKSSVSNTDTNNRESLSDQNDREGLSKSSDEIDKLTSSKLAISMCNQGNMTSADKNDTSNVILQASECVIRVTSSMFPSISSNTDSKLEVNDCASEQNGFLVALKYIATNDAQVDKEDYVRSEYESFVDESVRLNLSDLNDIFCHDNSQSDMFDVDAINLNLNNPVNLIIDVIDHVNVSDLIRNLSLDLSANNFKRSGDFTRNIETGLEQVARITHANAIPCAETSKDSRGSESETTLDDDLPSVITFSRRESTDSFSSSPEIYQSIEMLHSDSIINNHSDDWVECSKFDLPEEIEIYKCENVIITNKGEGSDFTNQNGDKLIDSSNNIHVSDINEVSIQTTTPADILQKSMCPIVTVTSPSPTQEKQLEELPMETSSGLLVPRNSHDIPNFGSCDSAFDKLKHDLKQRKARNKAVENGLRPLSIENARLKMSKYFTENKTVGSRSTRSKKTEETHNMEMMKLDIKPKLSNKVNAEEMLKYFKPSSSTNHDEFKACNMAKNVTKQNDRRKLEIDIEGISDVSDKDIDVIEAQFHRIEEQNKIAYLMEDDEMDSQFNLSALAINDKEEILCDKLGLPNDLIELYPELNVNTDHAASLTSSHNNISTLEDHDIDHDMNMSNLHTDSHIDIKNNISKLYTAISDVSNLHTNVESNIQNDITSKEKEIEKIDSVRNILKDDIRDIKKEKESNIKLNGSILKDDIVKDEGVIKMMQSNILNDDTNEEKEVNLVKSEQKSRITTFDSKQINKINISSDNLDADKKSTQNISENNIHLNTKKKLTNPLLLENNIDKVIKDNVLYKSDTNLNKSTSWFDYKNNIDNSKSLPELNSIIRENELEVKIVEKIISTSKNIKNPKFTNNNAVHDYIEEVPRRPERKHVSHINVTPKVNTTEACNLIAPHIESVPPEVPIRKKSAKRNFDFLHHNKNINDTPKSKEVIKDITKLHNQTDNASNIQNQHVKKLPKILSQDKNIDKLQNQNFNNIPELEKQVIPNIQNHDIKNILNPPKQNIAKLQSQNITNPSNLANEIIASKNITGIQNQNADVFKSQNRNESISSSQKTDTKWHMPDKSGESAKFSSSNNQTKKDKCVIS